MQCGAVDAGGCGKNCSRCRGMKEFWARWCAGEWWRKLGYVAGVIGCRDGCGFGCGGFNIEAQAAEQD